MRNVNKISIVYFASIFILSIGSVAHATLIDFTSTTWKNISGDTASRNIEGITVGLHATGGSLTWNNEHGDISSYLTSGLAGIGDGIGITNDEVSLNQKLMISFSPDVIVSEIFLLDLFSREPEYARFRYENSGWTQVSGTTQKYGFVEIVTGSTSSTSWLEFQTADNSNVSDYAVAGMIVNAVPEPATMFLLGTGLAGLAILGKRRKKGAL